MDDERTNLEGQEDGHDPCLMERVLLARIKRRDDEIVQLKDEIAELKRQAKSRDVHTRTPTLSGYKGNSCSGSPAKRAKHDSDVHKMVPESSSLDLRRKLGQVDDTGPTYIENDAGSTDSEDELGIPADPVATSQDNGHSSRGYPPIISLVSDRGVEDSESQQEVLAPDDPVPDIMIEHTKNQNQDTQPAGPGVGQDPENGSLQRVELETAIQKPPSNENHFANPWNSNLTRDLLDQYRGNPAAKLTLLGYANNSDAPKMAPEASSAGLAPRDRSFHEAEVILEPSDSENELSLRDGPADPFVASQYTGSSRPIIPDGPPRQRSNLGYDTIDLTNSLPSPVRRPSAKRVVMSDFDSSSEDDSSSEEDSMPEGSPSISKPRIARGRSTSTSPDPVSPQLSDASMDELIMPQQKRKSEDTKRLQKMMVLDEDSESPVRLYAPRRSQKMDQSKNKGIANRKQASQAAVMFHAVGLGSPKKISAAGPSTTSKTSQPNTPSKRHSTEGEGSDRRSSKKKKGS
ncbi:hypothetical protein C8R44DRAFT_977305 [Mycena epipterygia]|nr:hypothetical protein C8R44DRAFT_977305 [Mycena epipterygia]